MNDRAERFHSHIDHIEARIDLIGGMLAGNAVYDKWPMPREEYVRAAERLEQKAAMVRQHIEAFDKADRMQAEAEANVDAVLARAA